MCQTEELELNHFPFVPLLFQNRSQFHNKAMHFSERDFRKKFINKRPNKNQMNNKLPTYPPPKTPLFLQIGDTVWKQYPPLICVKGFCGENQDGCCKLEL